MMGKLSPKGEGRGEGRDILDLGVWVQKRLHPHPQVPLPKGEGQPDPTVSPRIACRHFVPLLPLNAYAPAPAASPRPRPLRGARCFQVRVLSKGGEEPIRGYNAVGPRTWMNHAY